MINKNIFLSILLFISITALFSVDFNYKKELNRLYKFTVKTIKPDKLKKYYDENTNFYILDTRQQEEYNVSRIKNARHVDYKKFKLDYIKDIPKSSLIIVYCSVGVRSERIGEKLLQAGYQNVFNLYGGIFEWINNDYPVYNENGKTNEIHGYSKSWSRWLEKGKIIL
jgi:rhodanese-related sulfurtransferase